MKPLPKPDMATWVSRHEVIDDYQRAWRAEAREHEQLYDLSWHVDGIPQNVPVTMPSTARAIIDEATDHSDFNPSYVKVHTPTYGIGDDAEKRSGRIKAFFPGFYRHQITHKNDVSPYRDLVKNVYLYGKGVLKTITVHDEWPELEIPEGTYESEAKIIRDGVKFERELAMPILQRSINPLAIWEDPTEGQKRYAIEKCEYTALQVRDMYPSWSPTRTWEGKNGITPSEMVETWDCVQAGVGVCDIPECPDNGDEVEGLWHQILIGCGASEMDSNASAVVDEATETVFLPHEPFPYEIKFSGYGKQSSGKYEDKARGLLYAVKSVIRAEARRFTQMDAIIAQLAWPTIFVTGPRSRMDVKFGPNIVNYVPMGVTVTPVVPPLPSGPIQQTIAMLQSSIERGTFGSVIRGDKPPQTTSAAQLSILSGQARLRFGSIKIHLEAMLESANKKIGMIQQNVLRSPLTLFQTDDTDETDASKLVLREKDIPKNFPHRVEILTDPREERERRAQFGVLLKREGIIDWEAAAEMAGIEDTAAMRRRVIRDKALFDNPAAIALIGETLVIESGYDMESLTLEKMMRDMLAMRRQQRMQEALFAPQGGANQQGSLPGMRDMAPQGLGGRPEQMTSEQANQDAQATFNA